MSSSIIHRPVLGVVLMVAGISILASMDVLIKIISQSYSIPQVIFFRSLLSLPVLLLCLRFEGGWKALKTERPFLHVSRGFVMALTTACFVFSFQQLPLSDVYSIIFSSPLIVTLLAIPLLGERVGMHRMAAVAVGFIGVIIAMQPGFAQNNPATYVALFGAFSYAMVQIFIRQMSETESTAAITIYGTIMIMTCAGAVLPWFWTTPTLADFAILAVIGAMGGAGQYCLTSAFRYADASLLSPYNYLSLIWGAFYGFAVFGDIPGLATIIGSVIIVASGLYIIHREAGRSKLNPEVAPGSDQPPQRPLG
ncbi:MAG: DMT family transporter [Alphaproteobacteria bacterium]|nr:DMT family transporter [Alphaproteobacteria bacterium SS10]